MIDNALSHASLKLGVDPKMEPLALADLLRDIELDAGADAQARGVDLVVAAPGGTVISADPRLLRSAVFNLVQNALKFSRAGSTVTISVADRAWLRHDRGRGRVRRPAPRQDRGSVLADGPAGREPHADSAWA